MNYKGFEIAPVYFVGSDFKVGQNGTIIPTKPVVQYYQIIDPKDGTVQDTNVSRDECKQIIRDLLQKLGMKDNTNKSWEKLEGYYPGFHEDWKNRNDALIRKIRDDFELQRKPK